MSALEKYKVQQLDEPNVTIPLPSSYNERGINGFTTVFTSGLDQRKINSFYEVAQNSETGQKTVYLTKRPGCVDSNNTLALFPSDIPYLAVNPSLVNTLPWVIATSGVSTGAANVSAFNTIFFDAGNTWYPAYVDTFIISGVATVVLTARRSASFAMRTFYASVINSWTEITDSNFTGLVHRGKMQNIDGWSLQLADDNKIYNSALNSLSSWPSGNFLAKQVQQDVAAGLAKLGSTILAFGDNTVEGFRNQGNPTGSPLVRVPELSQRIGLGSISGNSGAFALGRRDYAAVLGNKLYFIGRPAGGISSMGLYVFNGSQFDKVSPSFIDKIFAGKQMTHVTPCSFYGKSAIAIALDVATASPQRWLMYFPEWNDWFEWNSTFIQPANSGEYFIGITGTAASGKLGLFTPASETWMDGVSSTYTMTHQFRIPKNSNSRWIMDWAGVVADTAASTTTSNLSCEFSDDGGTTFGTARNIDLTQDKKHIYRCGAFRDRLVRLKHTANLECRLYSFLARIDK